MKHNTQINHPIREGVGITYRSIAYETSGKLYTQIDCETDFDIVKMLISGSLAIQGGIWVVNAVEGITPDSEAQPPPRASDAHTDNPSLSQYRRYFER